MRHALLGLLLATFATSASGQSLPDNVRSAGVTVQEYTSELEAIRALARARGVDARNALARLFAERGWAAVERGDPQLAARYALAGWRVAPGNEAEYRALLANVLFGANTSVRLAGGHGALNDVDVSTGGALIATAASDGAVLLWDGRTHTLLRAIDAHRDSVSSVQFDREGRRLLSASMDGTAFIWDASSGARLGEFHAQRGGFDFAAWSPDEGQVLTTEMVALRHPMNAFRIGPATIWDAASGERLRTVEEEAEAAVWSGDGRLIATSRVLDGGRRQVRVSQAPSGEEVASFDAGESTIWSLRFSADGAVLVAGSQDQTARVWNLARSADPPVLLAGHGERINDIQVAGDRIVTASDDGRAIVWNTRGERLGVLDAHLGAVRGTRLVHDGAMVVTYSNDGSLIAWTSRGGRFGRFSGHTAPVSDAAVSGDGLVSVSRDGDARVWPNIYGRTLTWFRLGERRFSSIGFTRENAFAIMFDMSNRSLSAWTAASASETLFSEAEGIDNFTLCPRAAALATYDGAHGVRLRNLNGGAPVADAPINAVEGMACGGEEERLVIWTGDRVHVLEPATGRELASWPLTLSPARLDRSVWLADNGRKLVVQDRGRRFEIRDVQSGRVLREGSLTNEDYLRVSEDGDAVMLIGPERMVIMAADTLRPITTIAAGGFQHVVVSRRTNRVFGYSSGTALPGQRRHVGEAVSAWELSTGRALSGLTGITNDDAYFDGRAGLLATWSRDGVVQIWDQRTLALVSTLRGHEAIVKRVIFSSQGDRVVTAANDGSVRVWDTRTGREIAGMGAPGQILEDLQLRDDDSELLATAYSVDRSQGSMLNIVNNTAQLWDVSVLFSSMGNLAQRACEQFLTEAGQRFSEVETAADPLVNQVWLAGRRDENVCAASRR